MGAEIARRFRQSDLTKALKAAKGCGYEDVRITIDPASGKLEIIVGRAVNDSPPVELD